MLGSLAHSHLCLGLWFLLPCSDLHKFLELFSCLLACAELMAEARVMDQLSSGDSSSDSNSSSSSSSDDSSSSSDSEDDQTTAQTSAPAKHSMPVINTSSETNSHRQERAGGLMNTLSESLSTFSIFTHVIYCSSKSTMRFSTSAGRRRHSRSCVFHFNLSIYDSFVCFFYTRDWRKPEHAWLSFANITCLSCLSAAESDLQLSESGSESDDWAGRLPHLFKTFSSLLKTRPLCVSTVLSASIIYCFSTNSNRKMLFLGSVICS